MICIDENLKTTLKSLAEKYEVSSFCDGDPSCILRRYHDIADIEIASFIAAMLAFGRREQFLPKIDYIMKCADKYNGPAQWILGEKYLINFIPENIDSEKKFYRFYSWTDLIILFSRLNKILKTNQTLGNHIYSCFETYKKNNEQNNITLVDIFSSEFYDCRIVPKGKNSANKRVHMFLRWMVRRNSQVDLGLWTWYNPAELIIPLDTHVLQEAIKLGLLPEKSIGSAKTAKLLTEKLKEIWHDDPCKGDFALFGLGVSI